MHFIRFSANTTNIFPLANTVRGGQLTTEFNLRSRESVGVGPASRDNVVEYMIGPSFVHGEMDFYVRPQSDGLGLVVEPAVLEIFPGRAVLNGHFVENHAPMLIDLLQANALARQNPEVHGPELAGDLIVGIRILYATEATMASTMFPENAEEMYQGIQLVVLPPASGRRTQHTFNLPSDVPKDPNLVTAHIELARFHFSNGRITGANARHDSNPITNNYPGKTQWIDGSRIYNMGDIDGRFVTKTGLQPHKVYAMAGRGSANQPTWCDITANLIVWDRNPDPAATADPFQALVGSEATFVADIPAFNGRVKLVMPRRQVEGMTGSDGNPRWFLPKITELPLADFIRGTSGTVDRKYTNHVKRVLRKIHELSSLRTGKQRAFVPRLNARTVTSAWATDGALPVINQNWNPGDYVLVGEDTTLATAADTIRPPSSLYPIIPGIVFDIGVATPVGDPADILSINTTVDTIRQGTIVPGCRHCGRTIGQTHISTCTLSGLVTGAQVSTTFFGSIGGTTTGGTPHNHDIEDSDPNITKVTEESGNHRHSVLDGSGAHEHNPHLQIMNDTHDHRVTTTNPSHSHGIDSDSFSWPAHTITTSLNNPRADQEGPENHNHTGTVPARSHNHSHEIFPASQGTQVEVHPDTHTHEHDLVHRSPGIHGHDSTSDEGIHDHVFNLPVHTHGRDGKTGLEGRDMTTGEGGHTHGLDRVAVSLGSGTLGASITAINEPYVGVEVGRQSGHGPPPLGNSVDDIQRRRELFGLPSRDDMDCPVCTSEHAYIHGIPAQDYMVYEDYEIPLRRDLPRHGDGVFHVLNQAAMLSQACRICGINISAAHRTGANSCVVNGGWAGTVTAAHTLNGAGLQLGDYVTRADDNNVWTPHLSPTTLITSWVNTTTAGGFTRDQLLTPRFYWFQVTESGPTQYADTPVIMTGEIPLATEGRVGGFLNVQDTFLDQGYVRMNEEGHLQLIDYGLLRTGVLAYQLGEDFSTPPGIVTAEVQGFLNEWINQRVAFPNWNQQQIAEDPNVIHIYLTLAPDDPGDINLFDVDSRFGTSIFLHINGNASRDTIINISDCQKVRIDPNIGGNPTVNLYRSNLYYDAEVLDKLNIIDGLGLWYERFDELDPNLMVDGMTVREVGNPIIPQGTQDFNFWDIEQPNDNHFQSAVRSFTFGVDGTIIGWEIFIKNESTANIAIGDNALRNTQIFSFPFTIPQGRGLNYPVTRVTRPLKVSGTFVNAYPTHIGNTQPFIVLQNHFTVLSQVASNNVDELDIAGTITIFQDAVIVNAQNIAHDSTYLDSMSPGAFHIFQGGSLL